MVMTNILYETLYGRGMNRMTKKQESKDQKSSSEDGTAKKFDTIQIISLAVSVLCLIATAGSLFYTRQGVVDNKQQKVIEDAIQMNNIEKEIGQIDDINSSIVSLEATVNNLNGTVSSLNDKVGDLENGFVQMSTTMEALQQDVEKLKNSRFINLIPSDYTLEYMTVSKENNYCLSNLPVQSGVILANNKYTKEGFTGEDLAGENVLLPYMQDGQEVYFYGQVNEMGQWDGDCLVNVYEDNELIIITDANYTDGKINNYKQAFVDESRNIWYISNRENKGDYNEGETWSYYKNSKNKKNFSLETVQTTNMINVDDFKKFNVLIEEGYYHGQTSNGRYNDTTGDAYSIKFAADGTIRTLYVGNMVDGQYEDYSGNAWYITKSENTDYMYYKGFFENGKTVNNEGYIFENNLSLSDIEKYISGYEFDIELNWYQN